MRLDKTVFKKQTLREAADHQPTYDQMDGHSQKEAFHQLMAACFGYVGRQSPQMEKQVFAKRSRDEKAR